MVSGSSQIIYQEENYWFMLCHKLSTKSKTEGLWFVWVEKRRWDMWPVASPRRRVQSSSCWWWQSFAFHGKCIGTATFAEPPNGHDAANLLPFCAAENELYLDPDFLARCRCQSNSHENAEDAATCQMCVWYFAKHKLVTILLAAERNTKLSLEHMHSFLLSRSKHPLPLSFIIQNCKQLLIELPQPTARSSIQLIVQGGKIKTNPILNVP